MWMEAEFQGSWHLYKTYPLGLSPPFLFGPSFLWLCRSLFLSACVSVPFFLPSPRPRPPWVYLWSGLARASCTGINRTQLLSSGCAARSLGAPRTRVGKEGDSLAASPGQASPGLASVLLLPLSNALERNGRSVGRGAAGIRKGEGGHWRVRLRAVCTGKCLCVFLIVRTRACLC